MKQNSGNWQPPEVRRVHSENDWQQATALLFDYVEWVRTAARIDPLAVQPCFAIELATLTEYYAGVDAALFIAWLGDVAVGTVAVRFHEDGTAELKRMYVRPVARGMRLADRLVASALHAASDRGCHSVWLESLGEIMAPAINVYRRNGFAELDEPGRNLAVENVVVMECPLSVECSTPADCEQQSHLA